MVSVANELVRQGRAVDIVVLKRTGEYESHVDARVRIFALDAWRMLFSLPKLVRYLKRERPLALMATDEHTHLLALMGRFLSGVPVRTVLRVGNMYSELYARYTDVKHALLFKLMQAWYRYADIILANSRGVADDIHTLTSVPQNRLRVIYNPKPVDEIRKQMQMSSGHPWLDKKGVPVIITHGRLREQKNLFLLIRSFAVLTKRISVRLVLVGTGRDEDRLRAHAQELGVGEHVAFAGYATNPYAYLAKADCYVSASLWEGMSNSLVEAMICGVPVVASDCASGPREVLAPDTDYRNRLVTGSEMARHGILVAVNDEEALTDALEGMITDKRLSSRYRAESLARATDFDEGPLVREYESALYGTA